MPAVALPPIAPVLLHVTHQHADWIFSHLAPRGRIVALARGHLSLTDMIAAATKVSGPARITICVWGISYEDVGLLQSLRNSGAATAVRLLVPPKPPHTATKSARATDGRPTGPVDDYDALRSIFGAENIVNTATHAKIALVENDRWSIAIRGSMLVRAYATAPQLAAAYPKKSTEQDAARAAVAELQPGKRVFGITHGFSLAALVAAILEKTGPATVSVMTARCSKKEADFLASLGARLVLGQSVVALAKETAAYAERTIGPERVRVAMVHAKIVTIRNAGWSITARSSMNMSANLRAEQFDVCDDAAVADQADRWISSIFDQTPPGIRTAQTTLSRVERLFFSENGTRAMALPTVSAFRPLSRAATQPITLPRRAAALQLPLALPQAQPRHAEKVP